MNQYLVVICLFATLVSSSVFSTDWDNCAYALDGLRLAARDANDAVNSAKTKADDFERCKRYPDVYDFMRDQCSGKAYDYQSAASTGDVPFAVERMK